MAQIVWTEPALIDLDEIATYIALDKPDVAKDLVRQVFSRVDNLKQFPDSGSNPPRNLLNVHSTVKLLSAHAEFFTG